jgi:hypothetical protein
MRSGVLPGRSCRRAQPGGTEEGRQGAEGGEAACAVRQDAVEMVRPVAGPSPAVEGIGMQRADVMARAKRYGVERVPGVVAIDGKRAGCRVDRAPDEVIPLRPTVAPDPARTHPRRRGGRVAA